MDQSRRTKLRQTFVKDETDNLMNNGRDPIPFSCLNNLLK